MEDDWDSPARRLRVARERQHILEALAVAQAEWRAVAEVVHLAVDDRRAMEDLRERFRFTEIQAIAVLDMQVRRLTAANRERIAEELASRVAETAERDGER